MKFNITLANIILAAAISVAPAAGLAGEPGDTIKTVTGDFEEVFGDLQDAVINRGLVIDYVGHVATMLERTVEAAKGSDAKVPYLNARYLQFCSSALTHEAVDADVQNLAMCPYLVFAYETRVEPGKISVGYRQISLTPSPASQAAQAKVENLLESVVKEAIGESQ